MTYRAPIDDICFALEAQVGLDEVRALPQFAETDKALTRAILEEAGKFAEKTIAPLNASADREGCALEGGEVRTASGFREAYRLYAAGGWECHERAARSRRTRSAFGHIGGGRRRCFLRRARRLRWHLY